MLLPDSRSLGRYRLLALLGQGGMADVYLATMHGKNGFTKLLVVKELRMLLANQPEFLDMFLDEARLAARLNHPNVVQTYEIESDGSRHFIGMEYLDGQPLSRVLSEFAESGGMPLVGYLRVLTEALSGLHYAHELTDFDGTALEVVHRDVTPHNVFVTYEGQVKLVDFGIAKAVDSSAETRVGLLKGKVGYLSPEQARGEKLDRRSDVYSAGVILWEMIARRRMWRANPDVVVLNRLAVGDVPDIAEANAQVPPELARICARALAFKVDDRYPTADAFRSDLEGFLAKQADVLDTRAVGAIVLDAFRDERSQLRAVVRETLRDTSLLPSPDSGPLSLRARSETPASSRAAGTTGPGSGSIHEAKTAVLRVPPPRSKLPPVIFGAALLVAGIGAFAWVKAHPDPRREVFSTAPRGVTTPEAPDHALSPPVPLSNASGCGARDKPLVELTGDIDDDARLTCDKSYLLKFNVVVRPGSTLTIEPGTTIYGDEATRGLLVVQPGAKIVARGTREGPIVFTSENPPERAKPGDWGGVIVLGKAPINLLGVDGKRARGKVEGLTHDGEYGGGDADDSSGVLEYVRIEYSGTELGPNNEVNGLTLAGVGRGTTIDHVQIRYPADDCFEFFGGTADAKHLICQHPGDDGIDWDYGYTGRIQFAVVEQHPRDDHDGHGLEGDNDPSGSRNEPRSAPILSNLTLCGRGRALQKASFAILARRGTRATVTNLVAAGFSAGVDVRDPETFLDLRSASFSSELGGLAFPEQPGAPPGETEDDDDGFDELAFLGDRARHVAVTQKPVLCSPAGAGHFKPEAALTSTAATPPTDGFFDSDARFLGAFRDREDDWERGWTASSP